MSLSVERNTENTDLLSHPTSQLSNKQWWKLICRFFGGRLTAPMHKYWELVSLQTFIEHVLCGGHCDKDWGYEDEPDLQGKLEN